MNGIVRDPASFRDHAGHVFHLGDRILRSVSSAASEDYRFLRDNGLLERFVAGGMLIATTEVETGLLPDVAADHVVEHPRIPFVSYPYEWGFEQLKSAALLTLDLHIEALNHGATLIDASAYNVQFVGSRPVFIDLLSLRRYRDGEYWVAQRQFCQHFLGPLLLGAALGLDHNPWLRARLDGIPAVELCRILPWHWQLRLPVLSNLVLPTRLQKRGSASKERITQGHLPKPAFLAILHQLRHFIAALRPKRRMGVWEDYDDRRPYRNEESQAKRAAVAQYVTQTRPQTVWDIGCNAGDFSAAALEAGAKRVIGFDGDGGAIDRAFLRARRDGLDLLPLFTDLANPSPNLGWKQQERQGLWERRNADCMLALALIHHLVIGQNIPLDDALSWLIAQAPSGIIEFVPADDPTVQEMICLRRDFDASGYTRTGFETAMAAKAKIIDRQQVSESGRTLYFYQTNSR